MRLNTPVSSRARRSLLIAASFLVALVSCAREVTAPNRGFLRMSRGISFLTKFPEALQDNAPGTSALVDVAKVRVVLYRADSTVALDTMVAFPAGQDSVSISMSVPLSPTAPATGESLNMGLKYVSSAGDTVFKGAAPVTATAVTGTTTTTTQTPATVTVTVVYTGTGSTAKSVVASPRTQQVFIGDAFAWSGVAKDAAGAIIASTPIKWSSLDPDIASITNAATGAGTANKRGTARIVAELLTGPKDTVTLTVSAKSASLGLSSGNNQTGTVGQKLAAPIVGLVLGTDGLPVSGTPVTIVLGTGANATTIQATSDASGLVSANWTLGPVTGQQTATMTASGLAGSPVTFLATAVAGPAAALTASAPSASVTAGTALGTFTVTARDAFGNVATSFTGNVTVALSGSSIAALNGTKTVAATGGVANFTGLTVNTAGAGYTLSASATGVTGAVSSAFSVTPGAPAACPAASAQTQTYFIGTAVPVAPAVRVLDAFGNVIPNTSVTFAPSAGGAAGTASARSDANGLAVSTWTLGGTVGTQSLTATCSGVTTPTVFSTTAQPLGIKLNAGISPSVPTVSVAAGQPLVVPIVLDLTYPNGDNVASVSFDIQYDSTRFSLVSTAGGSFGSFFENTSAAASSGKITVGVFSPTAATATTTVYTLTLLAKPVATSSTSTVSLVVTAAGRENATNVVVLPRNMAVTITP